MTEQVSGAWLAGDAAQQLAADLVAQACKHYRIAEEAALPIVLEALSASAAVRDAVLDGHDVRQIKRTRQFRELSSATRRTIYYQLRRYDRPSHAADAALAQLEAMEAGADIGQELLAELASGHVSTVERLPGLAAFHDALLKHAGAAACVLDVGCGLYPLLFPFDAAGVTRYVAADKDPASVRVLESYARVRADGRLIPVRHDISDGWSALHERTGIARFDLALLLKLVPVLLRGNRGAAATLMGVPADAVVLSGAAKSMTKHRDIERRERAVLLSFVKAADLSVVAEFAIGDEYLIVTRRRARDLLK